MSYDHQIWQAGPFGQFKTFGKILFNFAFSTFQQARITKFGRQVHLSNLRLLVKKFIYLLHYGHWKTFAASSPFMPA